MWNRVNILTYSQSGHGQVIGSAPSRWIFLRYSRSCQTFGVLKCLGHCWHWKEWGWIDDNLKPNLLFHQGILLWELHFPRSPWVLVCADPWGAVWTLPIWPALSSLDRAGTENNHYILIKQIDLERSATWICTPCPWVGEVAWLRGGRKRWHWRMGEVAWVKGGRKR